jgi:hypothetical protein
MKIQNNSIIHDINDKVYYKDELYQIKLIQEDLVLIINLTTFKFIITNIFNIKGIK